MSDTKDTENTQRRPLTLRRSDSGTVKQSFSHGRSKQVAVEVKKKRVVVTPGAQPKVVRPEPEKKAAPTPLSVAEENARKSGLSEAELKARQAALQQRRADEERRKVEAEAIEEANRRRQEEARRLAEEEKRRAEAGASGEVASDGDGDDVGRPERGRRDGARGAPP